MARVLLPALILAVAPLEGGGETTSPSGSAESTHHDIWGREVWSPERGRTRYAGPPADALAALEGEAAPEAAGELTRAQPPPPSPGPPSGFRLEWHWAPLGSGTGYAGISVLDVDGDGGQVEFKLILRPSTTPDGHLLSLAALQADGSYAETPAGQEAPIPAGWNRIAVRRRAGHGYGSVDAWGNDTGSTALWDLDNGESLLEAVRLGYAGGLVDPGDTAPRSLFVDRFSSWR